MWTIALNKKYICLISSLNDTLYTAQAVLYVVYDILYSVVYGIVYIIVYGVAYSVMHSFTVEDDCELTSWEGCGGIVRSLLPE